MKRTLTDEQIRIFRHSEIHSILRERELQGENEDAEKSSEDEHLDKDGDHRTRNDALVNSDKTEEASNLSSFKGSDLKMETTLKVNNASESGSLDYGEDGSNRNNGQAKGGTASGPAVAGRKVISYADD